MRTELNRKRNNNCSQFDESTASDITFQQLKKILSAVYERSNS